MKSNSENGSSVQTVADARFNNISISSIIPDPNQPRKFFDQAQMDELTGSVLSKGVLQPILVRPSGKGKFMIVCGERRFKAAQSVNATHQDRNTIPAVIRELSDDEALELQIIENLQRKDVHPMEEAVAFKSLTDHGHDLKEVAARIGKSEFYARQRMKLNSLVKDWQDIFYQNRITNALAMALAMFDDKIQKQILKQEGNSGKIEIRNWKLNQYRGRLKTAPFDKADPTLNKSMGGCGNCKFNTGAAALFPESVNDPVCMHIECFKSKSDNHFIREFDRAQEDPSMIFVVDDYHTPSDKYIQKITKAGWSVFNRGEYDDIDMPEPPDFEEWIDDNEEEHEGKSRDEMFKIFEEETAKDFVRNIEDYEKKISGGKYRKAFCIYGDGRGKYLYVQLRKDKTSASKNKATSTGSNIKITTEDIDDEIKGIQSREKRAKELDDVKVWSNLRSHFSPVNNSSFFKGNPLSQVEREAIALTIYNKLGYGGQDEFRKQFKIDGRKEDFSKTTEDQLTEMLRHFMLKELPPSVLYSGFNDDALVSLKVAKEYFPSVLKDIQDKQLEIATKRATRVEQRIKDLQAKKKELKKEVVKPKTSKK